jgi:hypothetical protein
MGMALRFTEPRRPSSASFSLTWVPVLIARCLLLLLLAAPVAAQAVFSGYVRDADTGETLVGANLYAAEVQTGTVTNAYGFFSLALPADSAAVLVSYVGYEAQQIVLRKGADGPLNVALTPSATALGGVDVVAERADPLETVQMSRATIPVEQIKSLPMLLGEVDVLKALQLLPGVQSGAEGTSGLYVRGGGPDQNLILLDGAPVYNASHLFGFFSTFNADALKSVDLVKGGFPARYGGRLSSVIDLRMKEGNLREIQGEGALGLVASRLTVEGPIVKDRASFLVSGRRTYVDLLAKPFLPADEDVGYYFYDLNAKANWIATPTDRLYASLYAGQDRFYYDVEEGRSTAGGALDWGNLTGTLRWNRQLSDRLFVNTSALYSRYQFEVGVQNEDEGDPRYDVEPNSSSARYTSGIRDLGLRVDADYVPGPRHYVRFGGGATGHRYTPGAASAQVSGNEDAPALTTESDPIDAVEAFLYAEDDLRLSQRLTVNVGLHASGFSVRNEVFGSLEPRASARWRVGEASAVRASFASMRQYIHLLTNAGVGLPTDLWLPATPLVPPQSAHQLALGYTRTLGSRYEVSVEGYHKWMDGITEYREGASFLNTAFENWESQVVTGSGRAYGVELFVQKKTGRTTGWVGYTLAWSTRRFDELNGGERFPYRYDRRHDVSVVLNHRFSETKELAATWVFGTGPAATLPIGRAASFFDFGGFGSGYLYNNTAEDYGQRGGFRLPRYHRLDVALNLHKKTRWGERTLSFGAYNAYNRKNPFFVYLTEGYDRPEFRQVSLFPIVPSVSYRFRF